jgi:hypothetical protein
VLENRLVAIMKKRGVSGYTLIRARGAGAAGLQTGMLDVDTNLQLKVILPPARLSPLLDDLSALLAQGHHLIVFVSDVSVLRAEKFEQPMAR